MKLKLRNPNQRALITIGGLVLMDLAGQTQLLARQVGLGRSNFTCLFVNDRGTAWVVQVKPPR